MINVKYCKECGRPYDYPRCPYCKWTKKQKEMVKMKLWNNDLKGEQQKNG